MKSTKNRTLMIVTLILLLGVALRFYHLGTEPLWFDETWSAKLSQAKSIDEIVITALEYDEHPILQHIIFWYWAKLGTSEFMLRSLLAISGVLAIFFVYLIAKELFNKKTALISSFIFAISPLLVQFSQEFRPYMLIAFSAVVSVYFLIKALKENKAKYWICYVIFTVLSGNIDYLFALLIVAAFLFVLIKWKEYKKSIKNWVYSQIAVFVLLLPSLFSALYQMKGELWSQLVLSPYWKLLIIPYNFYVFSFSNFAPFMKNFVVQKQYLFFLVVVLLFYAYFFVKGILFKFKKNSREIIFLLVCLFVPILILYLINLITYIQLEPKRFLFVVFAYYILIARGISTIRKKWLLAVSLVLIIVIGMSAVMLYYKIHKEDWRELTKYIANNRKDGDVVGISSNSLTLSFDYYYTSKPIDVYGIPLEYITPTADTISNHSWKRYDYSKMIITENNFQYLFNTTFKNYSRLWFIQSREKTIDPNNYLLTYLNKHYMLVESKNFSDNNIKVYLYKLGKQ